MIAFNIAVAALVVAAAAMLANVWSVFRAGQWRNSDDGKAVSTKIAAINDRVTVMETKFLNIPTAADLEKVAGQIDTVKAISSANHELLIDTRDGLKTLQRFFYEVRDK